VSWAASWAASASASTKSSVLTNSSRSSLKVRTSNSSGGNVSSAAGTASTAALAPCLVMLPPYPTRGAGTWIAERRKNQAGHQPTTIGTIDKVLTISYELLRTGVLWITQQSWPLPAVGAGQQRRPDM